MNSISLVMLVLDEAEFIQQSLESVVPFVHEAIVIDQGSTDGTVDIIRKHFPSVRIVQVEGNFITRGEKYFRDLAAQLCNSEWMMIIDADEILSPDWFWVLEPWLADRGEQCGMVLIDYWQMIGSFNFHTPDSPLPNERPFLVKKHSALRGSVSCNGTACHSSYRDSIAPNAIARLPEEIACFHLGYAKRDLVKRFERNILRGDWTKDATEMAILLSKVKSDPRQFLPAAIPATPECLRLMPAWMRLS
jgi:glycosyltransferase involved in cell wall biosynthesis